MIREALSWLRGIYLLVKFIAWKLPRVSRLLISRN
jgi:hypothetical protein